VVNQVVENRCVEDRRSVELFARDRGADDGENPRTDDGADAERREGDWPEGFLKTCFGVLRLSDELVDGFTAKNLRRQNPTPLVE
jgi:hypothetical protein